MELYPALTQKQKNSAAVDGYLNACVQWLIQRLRRNT